MPRRVPDTTKIGKLIGFRPTLTLEQIVTRVVAAHRVEPSPAAVARSSAAVEPVIAG
jgi:hypothetical protein